MKTTNIDNLVEKGLILSKDKKYIKGCRKKNSLEGIICIPDSIVGFESDSNGFENCNKITHIVLPPNFGSICDNSFDGCSSLVSINIPDSVEYIGENAFRGCSSLQYIKIPKSCVTIYEPFSTNIFIEVDEENPKYHSVNGSLYDTKEKKLIKYYCGVLEKEARIEENTEIIDNYAFSGCTNLHSAILPDTIIRIGDYVFDNCRNLQVAIFPSNITEIPAGAFAGCNLLEKFSISENINIINDDSFRDCISLERIVIPSSVSRINYDAFRGCIGLKEVVIEGKPTIEQSAFSGCESLESFSAINIDECFLYTHLSDSKNLVKIISSSKTINASDVFRKNETELKVMSMLYNGWGMNITKIRGNMHNPKSFKSLDERWNHSLEEFYDKEQSKSMILAEDWSGNSGIGLVLGWNDYHAIDVDSLDFTTCLHKKNKEAVIDKFLELLGLPKDYPWIVKSGSGCGFHIIFKCEKLDESFSSKSYTPNLHYVYYRDYSVNRYYSVRLFQRLELRWEDHLILPPSIHASGQRYEFYNGIPNSAPAMIGIGDINNLIIHYCGRLIIDYYTFDNKTFKLIDMCKCFTKSDSWRGDEEVEEDSMEWLEKANTPEALNTLALEYVLDKSLVSKKKAKELFEKSNSDLSNYNLASLISCGYFEGSSDDVEYYLSQIKNTKELSYVEYNTYDDSIVEDLFAVVRNNAKELPSKSDCILFFDTETTGLPKNYNAASSDTDNWPRLVQLSWILTTSKGQILNKGNYIVKPQGFVIPKESSDVHGITTEYANSHGAELQDVLDKFIIDFNRTNKIVGHNINYDKKIIGAEMYRMSMADIMDSKETICTMKSSTDFCQIPGFSGFKFPTLQELYKKLFNENFDNAHDAESDVMATMKCYFELVKRKII